MRLAKRPVLSVRVLATSFALSVLATLLVVELGAIDILGLHSYGALLSSIVAVGLVLGAFGAASVLVAADAALVVLYLVIAFTPLIDGPAERWVRNDPRAAGSLGAVVVLSGWVKPDSELGGAAVERLLTALELMKTGVAPRLVTTRVVNNDVDHLRITSDYDQRRLVRLAGLENEWTEVDSVGTTHDEATRSGALLLPLGASQIAVVTSPLHTRRACAVFEGVGFVVRCVASRELNESTWHPSTARDRLAAFRDYVYERLGMVKYRSEGWIKS